MDSRRRASFMRCGVTGWLSSGQPQLCRILTGSVVGSALEGSRIAMLFIHDVVMYLEEPRRCYRFPRNALPTKVGRAPRGRRSGV